MPWVEADRPNESFETLGIRRARVEREAHARGNDVSGAWLDVELPDSRNRAGNRSSCIPDLEYPPRRRDQCVVASVHRRRPRMPSASLEHELCSRVADDPGDDSERHVGSGENRTLLDVKLEESGRERAACCNECSASDAPHLLSPERDHGARADTFDRVDRCHHAERAVEPPAARNRVEMRADPAGV